jgi:hypothetical protein
VPVTELSCIGGQNACANDQLDPQLHESCEA